MVSNYSEISPVLCDDKLVAKVSQISDSVILSQITSPAKTLTSC